MKIYIVQSDFNKQKYFGDTENGCPIPRKGEQVFVGYTPSPFVAGVIYYETFVYVIVDGIVFDE